MVKYALILIFNIQGMPAAVNVGEYANWYDCMDAGMVVTADRTDIHDIKCVKVPQ